MITHTHTLSLSLTHTHIHTDEHHDSARISVVASVGEPGSKVVERAPVMQW